MYNLIQSNQTGSTSNSFRYISSVLTFSAKDASVV